MALDDYDILGEIGVGPAAAVHVARRHEPRQIAALKEFSAHGWGMSSSPTHGLVRSLRERTLTHPNIVRVTDAFEEDGHAKVADFGVATTIARGLGRGATEIPHGSLSYLGRRTSPAHELGPQSDLRSIGWLTYELLTGRAPQPERPRAGGRPGMARRSSRAGSRASSARTPRSASTTPTPPARRCARPWTRSPRRGAGTRTSSRPRSSHPIRTPQR